MPETWSETGLVQEFKRLNASMEGRRFCFILGAGASVTSGIPAGGGLVWRWLTRLMERHPEGGRGDLKAWATAERLGIPGFELERAASFYPQIFERCFQGDRQAGFQDLEDLMKDKDPSVGYAFLAQILSQTRHRVVITTNFDNLVADALSIYTASYPLICGHESLAAFARPDLGRPLVAKIHRDLLMDPINDAVGVSALESGWVPALRELLAQYTPIFVGYGGNDGSLMDFLDALPKGHIRGRSFWCYLAKEGTPAGRVPQTVKRLGGVFVPTLGFDALMMQLAEALDYGLQDRHVLDVAEKRAETYRRQVLRLMEDIEAVREGFSASFGGLGPWEKRHTESELDPDRGGPVTGLGLRDKRHTESETDPDRRGPLMGRGPHGKRHTESETDPDRGGPKAPPRRRPPTTRRGGDALDLLESLSHGRGRPGDLSWGHPGGHEEEKDGVEEEAAETEDDGDGGGAAPPFRSAPAAASKAPKPLKSRKGPGGGGAQEAKEEAKAPPPAVPEEVSEGAAAAESAISDVVTEGAAAAKTALSRMVGRSETPAWWAVREAAAKALTRGDVAEAERIYRAGIRDYPKEPYLKYKLALLLSPRKENTEP